MRGRGQRPQRTLGAAAAARGRACCRCTGSLLLPRACMHGAGRVCTACAARAAVAGTHQPQAVVACAVSGSGWLRHATDRAPNVAAPAPPAEPRRRLACTGRPSVCVQLGGGAAHALWRAAGAHARAHAAAARPAHAVRTWGLCMGCCLTPLLRPCVPADGCVADASHSASRRCRAAPPHLAGCTSATADALLPCSRMLPCPFSAG